jgi:hypothetical protein
MLLEYQRRTNFPTRTGNARFCIDDGGDVYVQVNRVEPALDHDWTAPYPDEPVATIAEARAIVVRILTDNGFFDLSSEYIDEGYDGGFREELVYWDERGDRTAVLVDRARLPGFRALVNELIYTAEIADALR